MAVVSGELCGVICVNKPEGFTSFDVIAKMRGILKMKRLGHCGTLDPMATGVLPVLAGKAARAADMLPDHDKTYRASFRLGVSSDTQDSTGSITGESDMDVTREMLETAACKFRGDIMQVPPMYSAVSVNGKRLYELARQGKTVEREPRPITVYSLDIISYDEGKRTGEMEISCSKGTYIRTLISDMGDSIGCGGIMTGLVRTRACGYTLDDCVTLKELEDMAAEGTVSSAVRPVCEIFGFLPRVQLTPKTETLYRNGVRLDAARLGADKLRYAVYGDKGDFIGTAVVKDGEFRVEKNFY